MVPIRLKYCYPLIFANRLKEDRRAEHDKWVRKVKSYGFQHWQTNNLGDWKQRDLKCYKNKDRTITGSAYLAKPGKVMAKHVLVPYDVLNMRTQELPQHFKMSQIIGWMCQLMAPFTARTTSNTSKHKMTFELLLVLMAFSAKRDARASASLAELDLGPMEKPTATKESIKYRAKRKAVLPDDAW